MTPSKAIRSWNAVATFDGLLAGHRVEDEQRVRRLDRVADALELVHQLLVDLEAAGGVDDHRVERGRRARARAPRVAASTGSLRVGAVDRHADLRAELLELVDRGRALEVGGDEAGLAALLLRAAARAWPRSSSCPSPGGRRAG